MGDIWTGGHVALKLPNAFFPVDVQRLFYMDVWLRNDASVPHTNEVSAEVERILQEVSDSYAESKAAAQKGRSASVSGPR